MSVRRSLISSAVLEAAVKSVAEEIAGKPKASVKRDWTEKRLFRELTACILGSQVTFEQALAASSRVQRVQVIEAVRARTRRSSLIHNVQNSLRGGEGLNGSTSYRFWRTRSAFIVDTAFEIYGNRDGLLPVLREVTNQQQARQSVAAMAMGIGPKQASLFLRNAGYGSELAILDSHVLRFMDYMGLCALPKSISSFKEYETIEGILAAYARGLGWGLQVLDQAIWISMRVAQRMSLWPSLR